MNGIDELLVFLASNEEEVSTLAFTPHRTSDTDYKCMCPVTFYFLCIAL